MPLFSDGETVPTAWFNQPQILDDQTLSFGNDQDITLTFDPAFTMKDATAGKLLTFGVNQGLHLRSNSGGANKTSELLSLRAGGEYDRPAVAFYNHEGKLAVTLQWHGTNWDNGAAHKRFEIKAPKDIDVADPGMRTRFTIDCDGDLATSFSHTLKVNFRAPTGFSDGALNFLLNFQLPDVGDSDAHDAATIDLNYSNASHSFLNWDFSPMADLGTENLRVRFFQDTPATTGTVTWDIWEPGAAAATFQIDAKTGNINVMGTINQALTVTGILTSQADVVATDKLKFYSATLFEGRLAHSITAQRIWTYPDVTGTVGIKTAAPGTAVSAGVEGQWAEDDSFLYICVGANTWRRAAIAAW